MIANVFGAIMKEFDFDRVLEFMKAAGWSYAHSNCCPTLSELETMAWSLFELGDWTGDEYEAISSGGFRLSKRNKEANLELSFIVESVDWIGDEE